MNKEKDLATLEREWVSVSKEIDDINKERIRALAKKESAMNILKQALTDYTNLTGETIQYNDMNDLRNIISRLESNYRDKLSCEVELAKKWTELHAKKDIAGMNELVRKRSAGATCTTGGTGGDFDTYSTPSVDDSDLDDFADSGLSFDWDI